ncbi:MAG: hypothetical protein SF053_00560 [Bacteroidia bacterium]|nr:hypothetical protein [Bacteroidia bacterium]
MTRKDFTNKGLILGIGLTMYPPSVARIYDEQQAMFWAVVGRFLASVGATVLSELILNFIQDKGAVGSEACAAATRNITVLQNETYHFEGSNAIVFNNNYTANKDFMYPAFTGTNQGHLSNLICYTLNEPGLTKNPPQAFKIAEVDALRRLVENEGFSRFEVLPLSGSRGADDRLLDFCNGAVSYQSRNGLNDIRIFFKCLPNSTTKYHVYIYVDDIHTGRERYYKDYVFDLAQPDK